ncbi:MAG: hypothetical protein OXF79_17070 [Chloroflexi bacterium]|nr:hypothetical protein [Chloroflexota bacterium]
MKYHLDLFTPETWQTFNEAGANITGFRARQQRLAEERVKSGDIFLCYLTRLSRWCGALEVELGPYFDDSPILDNPDPYHVRFKVQPIALLEPELAVPIRDPHVWQNLTITNQYDMGHPYWTGFFRSSLNTIEDSDGNFLLQLLNEQRQNPAKYPFTDRDRRQLARKKRVRTLDREVEVEVPVHEEDETSHELEAVETDPAQDSRESIRYQAKVAQIGAQMGFLIWVPKSDKGRVLDLVPESMREKFLDVLPLNYDDNTLRTVEQIDVLWLKGRSMARAFEIEHTTAIYSGLLRMADLLALQPNMDIRLHIVAPPDKRERVLREIRRPVFSLLDRGPLYEQCSFLPYDSIDALEQTQHLAHMSDTIIAEYEETAEV